MENMLSLVSSTTSISLAGLHSNRWRNGDVQNADSARVHSLGSNYRQNASGIQCTSFCRRSFRSTSVRCSAPARAQDQMEAGEDISRKDADDNNAAVIAEETLNGLSEVEQDRSKDVIGSDSHQGRQAKDKGNVLEAVLDSANQAAHLMQSNFLRAGEYITGKNDVSSQPSESSGDAENSEVSTAEDHEQTPTENSDDTSAEEDAAERVETVSNTDADDGQNSTDTEEGSGSVVRASEETARHLQDSVVVQAQDFIENIKTGASRASEQAQATGKRILSLDDEAKGRSHEEGDEETKVLNLNAEDLEAHFIDIDAGSPTESIYL